MEWKIRHTKIINHSNIATVAICQLCQVCQYLKCVGVKLGMGPGNEAQHLLATRMVCQEQAGDEKLKKTLSNEPNLVSTGANTFCPLHMPHMYTLPLNEAAAEI
jgi:hypothetical protein